MTLSRLHKSTTLHLILFVFFPRIALASEPMERVRELLAQGHRTQARPLLRTLVEARTANSDAYLYLGVMEREDGRNDRAIELFETGLQVDETHPSLLSELAITYAWEQAMDKSLATYERLISLDAQHQGAILGRARILAWMGRHEDSLVAYEQILSSDPDNIEALRGAAFVLRTRMRYEAARQYYQRVVDRLPNDSEAQEGLREIRGATRYELQAAVGVARFPKTMTVTTSRASISYTVTPEVQVRAQYASDIPSNTDPTTGDDTAPSIHSGQVGLTYRINQDVTLDGSYELRVRPARIAHRVRLRGSLKISDHWVLFVGLRPGIEHSGRSSLLSDAGFQVLPSKKVWLMTQIFFYLDTQESYSWTAVETLHWTIAKKFAFRIGVGAGQAMGRPSLNTFLGLIVPLTSRFEMRTNYEHISMPVRRHSVQLSLSTRF